MGNEGVVRLLLEAGADMDTQDSSIKLWKMEARAAGERAAKSLPGATPLILAACAGHLAVIKLQLEAGASMTLRDAATMTALHAAAAEGHADVVRALIEAGHDVSAVTSRSTGVFPASLAASKGHVECVHILAQAGSPCCQGLSSAVAGGHLAVVRYLVERPVEEVVPEDVELQEGLHSAGWLRHLCSRAEGRGQDAVAQYFEGRLQVVLKEEARVSARAAAELARASGAADAAMAALLEEEEREAAEKAAKGKKRKGKKKKKGTQAQDKGRATADAPEKTATASHEPVGESSTSPSSSGAQGAALDGEPESEPALQVALAAGLQSSPVREAEAGLKKGKSRGSSRTPQGGAKASSSSQRSSSTHPGTPAVNPGLPTGSNPALPSAPRPPPDPPGSSFPAAAAPSRGNRTAPLAPAAPSISLADLSLSPGPSPAAQVSTSEEGSGTLPGGASVAEVPGGTSAAEPLDLGARVQLPEGVVGGEGAGGGGEWQLQQMREHYMCPVTQEVFVDLVMDGFTYERRAIKNWIACKKTSPMTNEPLAHTLLTPNLHLRSAVRMLFPAGGGASA